MTEEEEDRIDPDIARNRAMFGTLLKGEMPEVDSTPAPIEEDPSRQAPAGYQPWSQETVGDRTARYLFDPTLLSLPNLNGLLAVK